LDDEQLDSGDDENRYDRRDRMDEAADEDDFGETVNIMDVGLARAPVPATNDGEVCMEYSR
jgi:RNA polymerase-associated protein LEO1